MEKLRYDDLYVGLEVIDTDFELEGVVETCDDPHNVVVRHKDGINIYCFVVECEEGMYDDSLIRKI
jgi:hypothetical protein